MDQLRWWLRRPSTAEAVSEDLGLLSSRDDGIGDDEAGSHRGVGVVLKRKEVG